MKNINWSLVISFCALFVSSYPYLKKIFTPVKIVGKLISNYGNIGKFKDEDNKTLLLLKLSVMSVNKSFHLKDIDIDIKLKNNGWIHTTSLNTRSLIFFLDSSYFKLNAQNISFLNNYSILKEDEPNTSYLFTTYPYFKDDSIEEIKLIFKNFEGDNVELSFDYNDIKSDKIFYDDNIWIPFDPATNK